MEQNLFIKRAIDAVGSQGKLSKHTGLSQQFISKLLKGERGITGETAIALEKGTGGKISRSELRPDLWPPGSWPPTQGGVQ